MYLREYHPADKPVMRLFTAILLDDACRAALVAQQEKLRRQGVRAAFTPPALLHLTLVFIGETGSAARAQACLEQTVGAPFSLTVEGLGHFRQSGGDVLWAGVRPVPALLALQAALAQNLHRAGFKVDRRPYRPHITLARRALPPAGKNWAALAQNAGASPLCHMPVAWHSLMQSTRPAGTLTYTEIAAARMAAPAT